MAASQSGPDRSHKRHLIKLLVLLILCLQNSVFTVLRRYSQGVLKETYSKYEVLLVGEIIKITFSAYVISTQISSRNDNKTAGQKSFSSHIFELCRTSQKMFILSLIYGIMNILSFVALKNVSAGIFTICAQLKILTTATFSTLMLNRRYSWTKWRALFTLIIGVLLFSEPVWNKDGALKKNVDEGNIILGTVAVLTEVTLSGFASIYFEKVIKTDPEGQNLNIWERNFQLALGSFPVYLMFILTGKGGGIFTGWSKVTFVLALLGAAGGLLVALSIKYGDAILKTLATTGSIVLSSILDHVWLHGTLTTSMALAGCIVVTAIFDYSLDATTLSPAPEPQMVRSTSRSSFRDNDSDIELDEDEISLLADGKDV